MDGIISIADLLPAILKRYRDNPEDYQAAWMKCKTNWERRDVIRRLYKDVTPSILEKAQKYDRIGRVDPYWVEWYDIFTPIERDAWIAIRSIGIPLYPQYPVLNYFIDFGNPALRIGVEVDGKDWHLDKEKDRVRDQELLDVGWHIYRCTGREVVRVLPQPEIGGKSEEYYLRTIEGLLEAIGYLYKIWPHAKAEEHVENLCYRTLDQHRLVQFGIGG